MQIIALKRFSYGKKRHQVGDTLKASAGDGAVLIAAGLAKAAPRAAPPANEKVKRAKAASPTVAPAVAQPVAPVAPSPIVPHPHTIESTEPPYDESA